MVYKFHFDFSVDLTLLSIAIVFPLVFSIRGSFRRREKALQHLSQFRSSLKTLYYFMMSDPGLSDEDKNEMKDILVEISDAAMEHLKYKDRPIKELDETINKVQIFVVEHQEQISRKIRDRIFRFMSNLHESMENLHAINIHRTPRSLKAYCEIFLYLFPFIYSPVIIHNLGANFPHFVSYVVVMLTEFILISLFNIQDQLEYPFDDYGVDDINLDAFKFDRD